MFDNIRGVITFEAASPEPEAFINALKGSAAAVSELRTQKGKLYGNVYLSDFETVKRVAESCGAQVAIRSKRGGIFTVHRYRRRFGLIIGVLLAFGLAGYLSNIVLSVEVYGNETLTDRQVEDMLRDCGLHIGTFIPSADLREAERLMVSSSEEIAWIGLRTTGSRLQAEISEVTNPPEMVPTSVPCNVVSTRDAQIVSVNVRLGMLIPMLGDGVREGELLISGTVDNGKGGVYYSHAMGEIIGRYTESVTFTQPFEEERFDYGDAVLRKKLYFFGLRVPLYVGRSDFGSYEYDEEISYLSFLGLTMPVGIVRCRYKPYEAETVRYSPEQAWAILEEKIKLYEYNFFDEGNVTMVDRDVRFSETADGAKAVVKYTLESDIGKTVEIFAKQPSSEDYLSAS